MSSGIDAIVRTIYNQMVWCLTKFGGNVREIDDTMRLSLADD